MGAECTQKTIYISERLREALEYALTQEITVIEAPTGYGKTMAARQLEKMSSVPVKWVNAHD
nr:hypothetical protein [Lachnospiraceae bacterium]